MLPHGGSFFMKLKDYFEPFILYKQQTGCSKHTVVEYRRFIRDCFQSIADKGVKELCAADVAEIQEAGRHHGYWGQLRACSVFLQFCKYLDDRGIQLSFSLNKIKLPHIREREQDFFTEEDFESLVSSLPINFYGTRDRCLYELLWSTGLRINEALSIDVSNMDFKEREIKVKTSKAGEPGNVYISDRLEYWAKKWLELRKDDNPALFVVYNFDIRRLKKCQARKNLARYRKQFGITKKLTHPAFRSGYCTYVLNHGANIKEAQYLLRHRSERTTLKYYAKVQRGQVKQVHQSIFNKVFVAAKQLVFGA